MALDMMTFQATTELLITASFPNLYAPIINGRLRLTTQTKKIITDFNETNNVIMVPSPFLFEYKEFFDYLKQENHRVLLYDPKAIRSLDVLDDVLNRCQIKFGSRPILLIHSWEAPINFSVSEKVNLCTISWVDEKNVAKNEKNRYPFIHENVGWAAQNYPASNGVSRFAKTEREHEEVWALSEPPVCLGWIDKYYRKYPDMVIPIAPKVTRAFNIGEGAPLTNATFSQLRLLRKTLAEFGLIKSVFVLDDLAYVYLIKQLSGWQEPPSAHPLAKLILQV